MHFKVLVALYTVIFVEIVSARRCRPGPPAPSPMIIVVQSEATPNCGAPTPNFCAPTPYFCGPTQNFCDQTPNFCAPTPNFCGSTPNRCAPIPNCCAPTLNLCAPEFANICYEDEVVLPTFLTELSSCCTPKCGKCSEELVLPPIRAELPQGLGYFPSAVPLVAACFNPAVEVEDICCSANIPVVSPCTCATMAAPTYCPEWAPLVRPIIL